MPLSPWLPVLLLAQLLLLVLCTWLAVRTAIRPLTRLARAVDDLDLTRQAIRLDETGPAEVAYAAVAFNSMQDRIAAYVKERVQLLAAISHDLQTPITRMKLRVEFMEDSPDKSKLWNDLSEMQHLVKEGVPTLAVPSLPASHRVGYSWIPSLKAWCSITPTSARMCACWPAPTPCWKPDLRPCAGSSPTCSTMP